MGQSINLKKAKKQIKNQYDSNNERKVTDDDFMAIGIDLTGDTYILSSEQEKQFVEDFDEQLEEPLDEQLKEQLKKLLSEKQLKEPSLEKSLEKPLEEPLVVTTDGKITQVADKISNLIGGNN